MSLPVSLKQFIDELDMIGDESVVYLNRRTGEFLFESADDRSVERRGQETVTRQVVLPVKKRHP